MSFGHFLFLVCYVCYTTHAISLGGTEPQGVAENNITKHDFLETNTTYTDHDFYDMDLNEASELPGDSFIDNTTDVLENGNSSSVDSSGKNMNGTADEADASGGIAYTQRQEATRLGSRYKNGRLSFRPGDLTVSEDHPRHGALTHKDGTSLETGENMIKRKRRIQSSSATPSIQIVILIIGAVVGCLLLTGFVRWRVRGRLNAKKKAKMSNDFIYEDGRVYKGNSEMTTIYECDFEERQSMLRLGESLDVDMDEFQEGGTKFGEISSSQRFDMPLSVMSRAYGSRHSVRQPQARSPTSGRHFRLVPGTKRNSMNRHKHAQKNRYSKHLKRRLENMFVQTLDTIPMESSDSLSSLTFFSDQRNKHGVRDVSNEHLASTSLQQPTPIKHGSPTFRRGAFASILNTWRSLSFNRDWVGKMWQEQHNIRRLSDILRGRRESLTSSKGSNKDSDAQSSRLSSSTESVSSASSFGSYFTLRRNSKTGRDTAGIAVFWKGAAPEKASEQNGRSLVMGDVSITMPSNEIDLDDKNTSIATITADTLVPVSGCPEMLVDDQCISYRSYTDFHQEPAEYESLLSHSQHSCNIPARQFSEHPRYQRVHQRKRSENRKRASSFNDNFRKSAQSNQDGSDLFYGRNQDSLSYSLRNSSHVLSHADFDTPGTRVPTIPTTHFNLDHAVEHNAGPTSCPNVSNGVLTSPLVSSPLSQ